ncbi:hypothetical protein M438DRAFT_344574, partial [Aureobasidium pullulans EXF-150]
RATQHLARMSGYSDQLRATPGPNVIKGVLEEYLGEDVDNDNWRDAIQTATILMPEFFGTHLNGHPELLFLASEKIQTVLREIYTERDWEPLRDQVNNLVDKMQGIDTMICLNLGNFFGIINEHVQNTWVIQYAIFIFMWQKVNERREAECSEKGWKFEPIKKYFQDPSFDMRTKYLLQEIHRESDQWPNIILGHHEADRMIKDNTFVYAVHLPARASVDVLRLGPRIAVTNSSWSKIDGWERGMAEMFIEQTLLTQNPEVSAQLRLLVGVHQDVKRLYDEEPVAPIPEEDHRFFATSIYVRREELEGIKLPVTPTPPGEPVRVPTPSSRTKLWTERLLRKAPR